MACAAAQEDFCPSALVALPLGLSCGFRLTSVCGPPTEVCSRGCPGGRGSAPVRAGHGGGMIAWVAGALVVTGAQESQRSRTL